VTVATVLCLYEASGTFATLYEKAGAATVPVDIQLGTDIFDFDYKKYTDVVGVISHPPCTEFAVSGARWWADKAKREPHLLKQAVRQVKIVLEIVSYHKPKFWFIENPVGRICKYVPLGEPRLVFHPYEYAGWLKEPWGNVYTKKTLLWGDFHLPEKRSVDVALSSKMQQGIASRDKFERSLTPLGFAVAFVAANKPY
jgi:hypothetical protein